MTLISDDQDHQSAAANPHCAIVVIEGDRPVLTMAPAREASAIEYLSMHGWTRDQDRWRRGNQTAYTIPLVKLR